MSLVICMIWCLCAGTRDCPKFDTFVRETLAAVLPVLTFPRDGTVFDYFIDCQHGTCIRWNERPLEKCRSVAVSSSYVIIPEVFAVYFDILHTVDIYGSFHCLTIAASSLQLCSLQLKRLYI